jgi:hypothetical protein
MKAVSFLALIVLGAAMVGLYLSLTRRSRGIGAEAERTARRVPEAPEPPHVRPASPALRSRITLPDGTKVDPADPQERRRARDILASMDPADREAFLASLRRR